MTSLNERVDALLSREGIPGYEVTATETDATVRLDDPSWGGMAMNALLSDGLVCNWSGRDRIEIDTDNRWHPRTRKTGDEIDANDLVLALMVRHWAASSYGKSPYVNTWRHVLDCTGVHGNAEFGVAEDGGCETCSLSYPAVLWWVRCECGLVRLGTAALPLTDRLTGGNDLAGILGETEALEREYLETDESYPAWMPGFSHRTG